MISLTQLINATPFPKEEKDKLHGLMHAMDEEERFEITSLCWEVILENYLSTIEVMQTEYIDLCVTQNKEIDDDELDRIEQNLFNDLAKKLDAIEQKEKLEHIRQQLENYRENRTRSPQSDSS